MNNGQHKVFNSYYDIQSKSNGSRDKSPLPKNKNKESSPDLYLKIKEQNKEKEEAREILEEMRLKIEQSLNEGTFDDENILRTFQKGIKGLLITQSH